MLRLSDILDVYESLIFFVKLNLLMPNNGGDRRIRSFFAYLLQQMFLYIGIARICPNFAGRPSNFLRTGTFVKDYITAAIMGIHVSVALV